MMAQACRLAVALADLEERAVSPSVTLRLAIPAKR
jgi:hypothetical protein